MNDLTRRRWQDLLHAWAVDPSLAAQMFEDICEHYSGRGRFYHTLDHVESMMETVESLGAYAHNLNAVKLATWLHDVIYDSRASDNEERSAEYAEQLCAKLGIADSGLVVSLIQATKMHVAGGNDANVQVLIDADLAIFGARKPVYQAYREKIRQEYSWVPEPDFREGRRRVLESFLSRPRIYQFLRHLEEPARQNLSAEIAELPAASR